MTTNKYWLLLNHYKCLFYGGVYPVENIPKEGMVEYLMEIFPKLSKKKIMAIIRDWVKNYNTEDYE